MRTDSQTLISHAWVRRLVGWDVRLCRQVCRLQKLRPLTTFLRIISRLGDGVFWYALIATLPMVYGMQGLRASVHMVLVGVCCMLVYRWLKHRTARPRPADVLPDIRSATHVLDEFSFPSGHTLHAMAFTLIASYYFPQLLGVLLPFSLLIALSRPALGLHYPSDVLAGALLGAAIAGASLLM